MHLPFAFSVNFRKHEYIYDPQKQKLRLISNESENVNGYI